MKTQTLKKLVIASVAAASCGALFATPISNSATGLASPATTITFDEHALSVGESVTNQYSDLGVTFTPNLYYSSQTGFPNIVGNTITNFHPEIPQFSLNFLTTQNAIAFAMVSNSSVWNFTALLGDAVVESFSASVDTSANNFFGFTGINFDQIRITTPNDYMIIDNLQLSNNSTVPEPESLALVGLGLACLAFMRPKAKKA